MKHVTKQLFSLALLLSTFFVRAASNDVHGLSVAPVFRTVFSGNGLAQQANRCCKESDTLSAQVSAGVEFTHSMTPEKTANYFSVNGTKTMTFGVEAATATDIFSTNFFLPHDHASTVTFNPKLWSINGDFRLHVGLDEFVENLWLNVEVPVVHARWDLGLTEVVTSAGGTTAAAKFGAALNGLAYPYAAPIAALKGDKAFTGNANISSPLTYGKFGAATDGRKTKVGDVRLVLGYDLINKDNAQLGLGVLGLINGDEVSNAKFVNTPTIGTGGRHGIGGRVDGSVRLWENNDSAVSVHLRADGAYIFDATVRRSFDFTTNGVWSRYLLLKKHTAFNAISSVTNAVNVTSLQAKVGRFGMYDVNLMLSMTRCAWEVNVGYNLGGMTKEKLVSFVDTIAPSTYTFYGYTNAPVADIAADATNAPAVRIDGSNGTKLTVAPNVALADAAALTAAAVTNASLDQASGLLPNTMSHRIYGNIGYCYDKNEWMPSLSVGGSVELSTDNRTVRTYGFHGAFGICF